VSNYRVLKHECLWTKGTTTACGMLIFSKMRCLKVSKIGKMQMGLNGNSRTKALMFCASIRIAWIHLTPVISYISTLSFWISNVTSLWGFAVWHKSLVSFEDVKWTSGMLIVAFIGHLPWQNQTMQPFVLAWMYRRKIEISQDWNYIYVWARCMPIYKLWNDLDKVSFSIAENINLHLI
jgi:hypothetical protein